MLQPMPYAEQIEKFIAMQAQTDRELRATGFEEFLASHAIDPGIGLLVVGRDGVYSDSRADVDRDRAPLARRIALIYEIGVAAAYQNGRHGFYKGIMVTEALEGEYQQLAGPGLELDYIQFVVVKSAVERRFHARKNGMTYLTKSYRRIDPAGD